MSADTERAQLEQLAKALEVSLSAFEKKLQTAIDIAAPLSNETKQDLSKELQIIEEEPGNKSVLADRSFPALVARVDALKAQLGEVPKTPEEKYVEEYDAALAKLRIELELEKDLLTPMTSITLAVFRRLAVKTVGIVNRRFTEGRQLPADQIAKIKEPKARELDALRAEFVIEKVKTPTTPKAKAEVVSKTPEKQKIDTATWPEAEHPKKFQELKALLEKKYSEVALAPSISEAQLQALIIEIEDSVRIVTEDVLASNQDIDNEYNNATEIKRFLKKQYLEVDRFDPTHLTAETVIAAFKAKIIEIRTKIEKDRLAAEETALKDAIEAVYTDPYFVQLDEIRKELDPAHPIDAKNIGDITSRLQDLVKNITFLKNLDVDPVFIILDSGVKRHFEGIKTEAATRLSQLQKAFMDFHVAEIAAKSSSIPEFVALESAVAAVEAYTPASPVKLEVLVDTLVKAWKIVKNFPVTNDAFGTTVVVLSSENLRVYSDLLVRLNQRNEKLFLLINKDLIDLVEKVLNPKKPFSQMKYSEVYQLQIQLRFVKLKASGRGTLTAFLKNQIDAAQELINDAVSTLEVRDASTMAWEELIDEIQARNLDVWDHPRFQNPNPQTQRSIELYGAFHNRKNPTPGESQPRAQERIDWVVKLQIDTLQNLLQYEGQKASCGRATLMTTRGEETAELSKRDGKRDEILKALQYHPLYGKEIRTMLMYIITETTNLNSPISYDAQTSNKDGRKNLEGHIRTRFEASLRALPHIAGEANPERQDFLVANIFNLVFKTYYAFNLIDVGFAELQAGTKTKGHDAKNRTDYTFLSRPDAAMIHRAFRYGEPSEWSLNTLISLKKIPPTYGNRDDLHANQAELEEIQKELLSINDAYYDVAPFSGKNGVEASSLFNPWFPNMYNFLCLAPTERLAFGTEIWGLDAAGSYGYLGQKGDPDPGKPGSILTEEKRLDTTDLYEIAETGWKKILETNLGNLPDITTEENILEHNGMDGNVPKPGLIGEWIKAAGQAKMFQGEYLRKFIRPWLTHYLFRIFARFPATGQDRDAVFAETVLKLRAAMRGGLSMYKDEIMDVIRNISDKKFDKNPQRVIDIIHNKEKYKLNELISTNMMQTIRRPERQKWETFYYRKKGWHIPTGRPRFQNAFNSGTYQRDLEFYQRINAEAPHPNLHHSGVGRLGNFEKKAEAAH